MRALMQNGEPVPTYGTTTRTTVVRNRQAERVLDLVSVLVNKPQGPVIGAIQDLTRSSCVSGYLFHHSGRFPCQEHDVPGYRPGACTDRESPVRDAEHNWDHRENHRHLNQRQPTLVQSRPIMRNL